MEDASDYDRPITDLPSWFVIDDHHDLRPLHPWFVDLPAVDGRACAICNCEPSYGTTLVRLGGVIAAGAGDGFPPRSTRDLSTPPNTAIASPPSASAHSQTCDHRRRCARA